MRIIIIVVVISLCMVLIKECYNFDGLGLCMYNGTSLKRNGGSGTCYRVIPQGEGGGFLLMCRYHF